MMLVEVFLVTTVFTALNGNKIETLKIAPPEEISGDPICTPKSCYGLDYKSINNTYRGMFLTPMESARSDGIWKQSHRGNANDNDRCCPTRRMSRRADTHMTNIFGIPRYIFHMWYLTPPQYQWIHPAQCASGGMCHGTCQLEIIYVNLLVWEEVHHGYWTLVFDTFPIPGYCSCKNRPTLVIKKDRVDKDFGQTSKSEYQS